MSRISRRSLAVYAADRLAQGDGVADLAKHLAATLIENGQVGNIDYLVSDIAAEMERRGDLSVSRVASARPLSEEVRQQLIKQLEQATGATEIVLDEQVDESLIGGLRIESAGKVWDSTIRRKLQQLKEIA